MQRFAFAKAPLRCHASCFARLVVAIALFSVAVVASWYWLTQPLAPLRDEYYEQVKARGVLRVGMDASFPPFESLTEQHQLIGFDVELAEELARRMNLRVEFVTLGFDTLYEALAAQHVDIIVSALPYERLRSMSVAYSDIYFHGGEQLLARADDGMLKSIADLRGETLGVEWGSSGETLAKQLARRYGYRLHSYTSLEEARGALDGREVRALLTDAVSARLLRRAQPQLKLVGEPLNDEPNYVIAVPYHAPILLATINQQLRDMERDGTLKRLRDRWF
jgi:ABC-type amino acid transport substrate-binding protein